MIFFRKKASKKLISNSSGNNENKPPPLQPPIQQQIYLGSDSWLQLNLPDDFTSTIDIPQLHKKEKLLEQGNNSTAHTFGTCTAITRNISTSLHSESNIVVVSNINMPSPSPSFHSSLTVKVEEVVNVSSLTQTTDLGLTPNHTSTDDGRAKQKYEKFTLVAENNSSKK
jgi:hypothetical protein